MFFFHRRERKLEAIDKELDKIARESEQKINDASESPQQVLDVYQSVAEMVFKATGAKRRQKK